MRDVRPRALPPQDKLFDTEEYERSKPAAFLGTTKKRVDEADARAAGLEERFSAAAPWQYLGSTLAVPASGCSLQNTMPVIVHALARGDPSHFQASFTTQCLIA